MLSKIFNSTLCGIFKLSAHPFSNSFQFTEYAKKLNSKEIKIQILGISKLKDFKDFFNQYGKELDPQCTALAAKTLGKLFLGTQRQLDDQLQQLFTNFLHNLENTSTDHLSLHQFSQLLYFLRVVKKSKIRYYPDVLSSMKKILFKSALKFQELSQETDLSKLCYYYLELSQVSHRESKNLCKTIHQLVKSNTDTELSAVFTIHEISLFLKGTREKINLSSYELKVVNCIIDAIMKKQLNNLSFFELSLISTSLNLVFSANMSEDKYRWFAEKIHKKLLNNIDELDQKSILCIIKCRKTNNKTYRLINRDIFEKILDSIKPNGQCSLDEKLTLKLLEGLSNKVKLAIASPINQNNFINFFSKFIAQNPVKANHYINSFIVNKFLARRHLIKVLQILEKGPNIQLTLHSLFKISTKNINVEKFIRFEKFENIQIKSKDFIKSYLIMENIITFNSPDKNKYQNLLAKYRQQFFKVYKIEDNSLSQFITKLSYEMVYFMFRMIHQQFKNFPNPFQANQSKDYKNAWLKLVIYGQSKNSFNRYFANQFKNDLTIEDLKFILIISAEKNFFSQAAISNSLNWISKKVDIISKDFHALKLLIKMIQNIIQNIFDSSKTTQITSVRFWVVIREFMNKMPEIDFFKTFFNVITTIISSAPDHIRYSLQYQFFLANMLKKAEFMDFKFLLNHLILVSIKYRLITKEIASKILKTNIEKKNLTAINQKFLKIIDSNDFLISEQIPTKNNLHLFLFNRCSEVDNIIAKNKTNIISIIQEMKYGEIWKCITYFRLGTKKNVLPILQMLLARISQTNFHFLQNNPFILYLVLKQNFYDPALTQKDSVKLYMKKVFLYYCQPMNLRMVSLEDHIQNLKIGGSFGVKDEDYIHALFKKCQSQSTYSARQLYLTSLMIGVKLRQQEIQNLIQQKFFSNLTPTYSKCFTIFLLVENLLKNPAAQLSNLINKYNELKQKQKVPIYLIFYQFLKSKYPEETKNWKPNQIDQVDFAKSLQKINSKYLNLIRQKVEEVTKEKWVENIIHGNYYYKFRNVIIIISSLHRYQSQRQLNVNQMKFFTKTDSIVQLFEKIRDPILAFTETAQKFPSLFTSEQKKNILILLQQGRKKRLEVQPESIIESSEIIQPIQTIQTIELAETAKNEELEIDKKIAINEESAAEGEDLNEFNKEKKQILEKLRQI